MTLTEFIEKVRAENNIPVSVKDLEVMINKRAKAAAGASSSIGIDDETVKQWILSYDEWKKEDDKGAVARTKELAEKQAAYNAEQAKKKAEKEAEERAKAEAEEKAKREKEGQLSLWDL